MKELIQKALNDLGYPMDIDGGIILENGMPVSLICRDVDCGNSYTLDGKTIKMEPGTQIIFTAAKVEKIVISIFLENSAPLAEVRNQIKFALNRMVAAKRKKDNKDFEAAVKPLMKWLAENKHPNTSIYVESHKAELLEVQTSIVTDEFYIN